MNIRASGKNIDGRRVAGIAIVLLIVGYQYSRPTLEKWFDRDLPSLSDVTDQRGERPNFSASSTAKVEPPPSQQSNADPTDQTESYLRSIGRNRFVSPEGLLYTMGPKGEHRVDHVLRHGRDIPDRPVHSVFSGGKAEILAVIDEAYALVKAGSSQVKTRNSNGNEEHTVQMKRKVGYEGGQRGKRKGYPSLRSVKLVLDGNRVITAFPFR